MAVDFRHPRRHTHAPSSSRTVTPSNILIIAFGQLGDVVLCLPALTAVRNRFPASRLTIAVGKAGAAVIDLADVCDATIVVDRKGLRAGRRLDSLRQIIRLVRDVRARRFDLVIDIHSLYETNLLGFVSGAPQRLYAHRENRSLDVLSTMVSPREDKQMHVTDRYLDVLKPLGISGVSGAPTIEPRADDREVVDRRWRALGIDGEVVGVFPGAGHASRRWSVANFAGLAARLAGTVTARVAVFLGPEERHLAADVRTAFPAATLIIDGLTVPQFVAALTRLSVLISNDTGPVHLAAAVGTPVVVVLDRSAPLQYVPRGPHVRAVNPAPLGDITVEDVHRATQDLLATQPTRSGSFRVDGA